MVRRGDNSVRTGMAATWLVAGILLLAMHLWPLKAFPPAKAVRQQASWVLVYLHESGHAVGALLTGGSVIGNGVEVVGEKGWAWGTTSTDGGWPLATWGGGYIMEGVIVGLLAVALGSRRWRQPVLLGVGGLGWLVLLLFGPYGVGTWDRNAVYYTTYLPELDVAAWCTELMKPPTVTALACYKLLVAVLAVVVVHGRRPEWADRLLIVYLLLAIGAWADDLSLLQAISLPDVLATRLDEPFAQGDAGLLAIHEGGSALQWALTFGGWSLAAAAFGGWLGMRRWQREQARPDPRSADAVVEASSP